MKRLSLMALRCRRDKCFGSRCNRPSPLFDDVARLFLLFLLAAAALRLASANADAGDGDNDLDSTLVMQKLADYDSILIAGFTVSGTQTSNESIQPRAPLLKGVNRKWKLTFGGDRVGYRIELVGVPALKYEDIKNAEEQSEERQTARSATIRTKQWGYWGNDVCGLNEEYTVYDVDPTGKVTEKSRIYDSRLWHPTAAGPIAQERVLLWSMGRLFSRQIEQVTRAEKLADGHMLVSARGEQSPGYKGRWELDIDPAAAWMVRKARFYWDGAPEQPRAEMKNEGASWSGPHCIPKDANCSYWASLDRDGEAVHISFDPVVESFSETLYAEARRQVTENKTRDLTVTDYRASPRIISEPNKPLPKPDSDSPPAPISSVRAWLLIGNAILVLALVALFFFRRKRPGASGALKR
jgi:hypothetical protein